MAIIDNETTIQDAELKTRVKWVINKVALNYADDVLRTDKKWCVAVAKEINNNDIINMFMAAIITKDGSLDNTYSDSNLQIAVEAVWDVLSTQDV